MELWKFECKKLWKNKIVCGILVSCFFFNAVFLVRQTKMYSEETRCFPNSIKQVYEEMKLQENTQENIQEKSQESELENQSELQNQQVFIEKQKKWLEAEIEKADNVHMNYEYGNALRYVLREVEENAQYSEYLKTIKEQAEWLSQSSLFDEKNGFSKRNAEKIPKKYEHLEGLILQTENSQGILLATESKITDLFAVVLLIVFAYFVICMEREEGTMAFVRCTRHGGKTLGRTKIWLIFIGSLFGTFLLYTENIIIAKWIYGFGDTSRWIQSVQGFLTSPWKITVGTYLGLFLLGKLFATAVIASIVIFIVLKGKNLLQTSAVLFVTIAVEYSLYTLIPAHSWLDILKTCNLFYFIETAQFFKNYETINLFQYPISAVVVCSLIGIASILFLLFKSVKIYEQVSRSEYQDTRKLQKIRFWKKDWKQKKYIKARKHTLLYYEAYKTLWLSGAAAILIVFFIVQYMTYADEKIFFSLDDLYYKSYIKQLEGEMTEEKKMFLEEEKQRISHLENQLYELLENNQGEESNLIEKTRTEEIRDMQEKQQQIQHLEQQLVCKTAFQQVEAQAERIGDDGVFFDEVSYMKLLNREEQKQQIGKLMFVFILAFYAVFITEQTSGMQTIWNSISRGKQKILTRKWVCIAMYIIIACVAADYIFVSCRMHSLKITSLQYPVSYLTGFEMWKTMSIITYLIGNCFLKMLIGVCVVGIIAFVSKRAKNGTMVLLTSGSIVGLLYLLIRVI